MCAAARPRSTFIIQMQSVALQSLAAPGRGAGGIRQRKCQRPAMARRRQPAIVAMAAGSDAGGMFRDPKKVWQA